MTPGRVDPTGKGPGTSRTPIGPGLTGVDLVQSSGRTNPVFLIHSLLLLHRNVGGSGEGRFTSF